MSLASLRRLLLGRLIFNLAALLGVAQLLVVHWVWVVVAAAPGPGLAVWGLLGAALVAGNALAVPRLRRSRRRRDAAGRVSRLYVELGVATLLLGVAILVSWPVFALASGLLGALGGDAFQIFRGASLALVGGVAGLTLWGFTAGQARIDHSRLRIPVAGLAPSLEGLRLVQISDLHIGNALDGRRLGRLVARVNRTEPDVLVLTGDLFDFDPSVLEEGARALSALRARHGVYAILGNHDAYVGSDRVAEALARFAPGLRVLRNEIVRLPLPAPLYLAGVEDPGIRWFDRSLHYPSLDALAGQRAADGPTLLLLHQPQAVEQAAALGFPLVLSGHTHGGQLALPVRGGQINLSRLVTPLTRGLYRIGATRLYVNRGLGVGGPALRIHCNREIATLELRGATGSETLLEHVDQAVAAEADLLVGPQRGAVRG